MKKIILTLALLLSASAVAAENLTFKFPGNFFKWLLIDEVSSIAIANSIEQATGLRLVARTSTDTVHGYLSVSMRDDALIVRVYLYELSSAGSTKRGERKTSLEASLERTDLAVHESIKVAIEDSLAQQGVKWESK